MRQNDHTSPLLDKVNSCKLARHARRSHCHSKLFDDLVLEFDSLCSIA
jgi:hypothetical protein